MMYVEEQMGLTEPVTQTQNVKQEGDQHQDLVPHHLEFAASSLYRVGEQAVQTILMPSSIPTMSILMRILACTRFALICYVYIFSQSCNVQSSNFFLHNLSHIVSLVAGIVF